MYWLLILIIGTALGYDFRCPVQAEWKLKANLTCLTEDKYVCLFNLLETKYQEDCTWSDQSRTGTKLVFQPSLNLAECNTGKYQPFLFTTHGNSKCVFSKSKCNGEGQTVYSNGSLTKDIACGCDYSHGYAFVSKPKKSCFCIPSEEDCTCFRVECKNLSADYKCITEQDKITTTECQETYPVISFNQHNRTDQNINNYIKGYSNAQNATYIIIVILPVFVFIAVLAVKYNVAHGKPFVLHEKGSKLKNDIDDDNLNSKRDDDYKRQKYLHERITKDAYGKHYSTRVFFVGKNGVGKTSLMRRLLWQKKDDVTSTQSTDGIEIEKCNINILDGKWSPCEGKDDDLNRLIHQVYTERHINIERRLTNNVFDQASICSDTYEPKTESSKKGSISICSESGEKDISIISSMPISIDNIETPEAHFNTKRPRNIEFQNVSMKTIDRNDSESDPVNDDNINQLTSTILKSYLQLRGNDIKDKMAFCLLWDFAGQKDFYATHQVFLSKSAVYLLVTDTLDFTTDGRPGIDFEDSAESVSFWFDAIHCYWSTTEHQRLDPPIIVVCTHEDKFEEPLKRELRQRNFTQNLINVLRSQKKVRHLRKIFFVSNTEDSDDVFEDIRQEISRLAMDMEDWGRDCPLKWLLFQKVLQKMKETGVPISSTAKLSKIAKHNDIGITNDEELKLCLRYCHDNGTVIYFEEENLQDHVILDPQWLVDAFRCLVSDKFEDVITFSDHWQLIETGQLTNRLISDLFKKDPKLKFFENKTHILEVMKRFDIIVNLENSSELYMPCMMRACTIEEVRKHFIDDNQYFYTTSWFCLEFQFLPPAFFNHILVWYIKHYSVSDIIEKGDLNVRKALYRQIGVFDIDISGCEQLVVCQGPNIIALQIWNSRKSDHIYADFRTNLCQFVDSLRNRYRLKITYTKSFTCKDGDFTINRKKISSLLTKEYRCLEHKTNHLSDDLVQSWYVVDELRLIREKKDDDPDEDM